MPLRAALIKTPNLTLLPLHGIGTKLKPYSKMKAEVSPSLMHFVNEAANLMQKWLVYNQSLTTFKFSENR